MPNPKTLWTPRFVVLALANICTTLVFYLLAPVTATIASQQFGADTTQAGTATGIFFLGAVVARAVAAPVVARVGLRWTLLVSEILLTLTSAAYLLVANLGQLMAVRMLNGVAFGITATAITGAALSGIAPRRRGEATGWFTSGMALGTGVGPLISLNLMRLDGGYRMVLVLTAVVAVIGFMLALSVIKQVPGRQAPGHRTGRLRMIESKVVPISLVVTIAALAYSVVLAYLNDFSIAANLEAAAGFFFVVYAATMLPLRPVMGRLQDRRGNDIVIIPAIIGVIAGLSLIALAHSGWLLLAGAGLLGYGFGTLMSSGQAMALNLVDASLSTAAIATFYLLVDLGVGLGPTLFGLFADSLGFRGLFVAAAILPVFGLLGYLLFVRQRDDVR